jgi:hypothetical protein
MTFESHDTLRTAKSIINRLFHAIRHRRKQRIYRQLPQPTEILIESFLAIWMFSITGCLEAWIGDPILILFPVENARKISPEESYPFPPTRARPTVARFASRWISNAWDGDYLTLVGEERTICPYYDDYTSIFNEICFWRRVVFEP